MKVYLIGTGRCPDDYEVSKDNNKYSQWLALWTAKGDTPVMALDVDFRMRNGSLCEGLSLTCEDETDTQSQANLIANNLAATIAIMEELGRYFVADINDFAAFKSEEPYPTLVGLCARTQAKATQLGRRGVSSEPSASEDQTIQRNRAGTEISVPAYRVFIVTQLAANGGYIKEPELYSLVEQKYKSIWSDDDKREFRPGMIKWKNSIHFAIVNPRGLFKRVASKDGIYFVLIAHNTLHSQFQSMPAIKSEDVQFTKKCPNCGRYINLSVRRCPFCGDDFPPPSDKTFKVPK